MPISPEKFVYLKPSLDNCQARVKARARKGETGAAVNKVDRKAEARGGVSIAYQARLMRAHEAFLQGRHVEEFPKIAPRLEKDVVVVEGPLADADFSCPGTEADRTFEHVVEGLLIKRELFHEIMASITMLVEGALVNALCSRGRTTYSRF